MTMLTVTVYQYTTFDPKAGGMRVAPRRATRKAIENLNRVKAAAVILRRFPLFDDEKIVSTYARGMSMRRSEVHIRELYGLDVSPDLASAVTAVPQEVAL
jgi:hypothetical protein